MGFQGLCHWLDGILWYKMRIWRNFGSRKEANVLGRRGYLRLNKNAAHIFLLIKQRIWYNIFVCWILPDKECTVFGGMHIKWRQQNTLSVKIMSNVVIDSIQWIRRPIMREDIEIRPLSKRQDCEDYVRLQKEVSPFRNMFDEKDFCDK